jgi:hypothetical protein
VAGGWRFCLDRLAGADAVGCHWITPDEYAARQVTTPFFGGNFWWARCGYLAGLAEPPSCETDRHLAEAWVGGGNPRVYDLRPGWPAY